MDKFTIDCCHSDVNELEKELLFEHVMDLRKKLAYSVDLIFRIKCILFKESNMLDDVNLDIIDEINRYERDRLKKSVG